MMAELPDLGSKEKFHLKIKSIICRLNGHHKIDYYTHKCVRCGKQRTEQQASGQYRDASKPLRNIS